LAINTSEYQVFLAVKLEPPDFLRPKSKSLDDVVEPSEYGREVIRFLSRLLFDELASNRQYLIPV
jgi:hypothetical protein